jgi:hypothetical protein
VRSEFGRALEEARRRLLGNLFHCASCWFQARARTSTPVLVLQPALCPTNEPDSGPLLTFSPEPRMMAVPRMSQGWRGAPKMAKSLVR